MPKNKVLIAVLFMVFTIPALLLTAKVLASPTDASSRPAPFLYWPLPDNQRLITNYPDSNWTVSRRGGDACPAGEAIDTYPSHPCYDNHHGTDVGGAQGLTIGTSVYSAAAGEVVYTFESCTDGPQLGNPGYSCPDGSGGYNKGVHNWGNQVWIKHTINGEDWYTVYAHLKHNSVTVTNGQNIDVGFKIGESGNTGASSGGHLHFELHNANPTNYNNWDDPWGSNDSPHNNPDDKQLWVRDTSNKIIPATDAPKQVTATVLIGDINADGKKDRVLVDAAGEKFTVFESDGVDFLGGRVFYDGAYSYPDYKFELADVNADNRADLIGIDPADERFIVWKATTTNTFAAGAQYYNGAYSYPNYTFKVGDVNADRRADIIAMNGADERFIVWKANSTGTAFGNGVQYYNGGYSYPAYAFEVADVNADGRVDVVGIDSSDERFLVWRANGTGTAFGGGVQYYNGGNSYPDYKFKVADVNADNRADIVGADLADERFIVWKANGTGTTFLGGSQWYNGAYNYPNSEYGLAVADVNGDKKADIVAVRDEAVKRTVVWKSNTTTGQFEGGREWFKDIAAFNDYQFFIGKTNTDAYKDVVAVDATAEKFLAWRSNAAKNFKGFKPAYDGAYSYPDYTFTIGDVNADGKSDLIAMDGADERFLVWKGTGANTFASGVQYYNGAFSYPDYKFYAADVNADNRVDIIGIDPADERVIVWKANGTGTAFGAGVQYYNGAGNLSGMQFHVADINADRRADIVAVDPADEKFVVWKANGTGTAYGANVQWYNGGNSYPDYKFALADVNADGRADVVGMDGEDERFIVWKATTTNTFTAGVQWHNGSFSYPSYTLMVSDVSGDNRADIVGVDPSTGRFIVWKANATSTAYMAASEWLRKE
jgi:murein DD-endopeptidase MepM/ murein hydrolase activator NlpD